MRHTPGRGGDGEDAVGCTKADGLPPLSLRLGASEVSSSQIKQRLLLSGQIVLGAICVVQFIMLYKNFAVTAACGGLVGAATLPRHSASSSPPDYFQTTPELFPGPTATGPAPFLAETNPAPFPSTTYFPPTPLETQVPIQGNTENGNIYQLMGHLSHYFPNPDGFGVEEYSLPESATIVQLNMLSRHGSRYPTTGSGAITLAEKIVNHTTGVSGYKQVHFTGHLSFLNTFTNKLGADILVPIGNQE